ncbi:MAG: PDDEXK nuclease domain-containing protein [Termitinemataceae bacterium]|nr:MAG: PDDEXK nuclease domain-containing protein [Termitinemataceae bacterium]
MVEKNQNIKTDNFDKIISLIENARQNVQQKVNEELINLYYKVGEFLSAESAVHSYGDAYIDAMSDFITSQYPDLKGFTRRGLYRMRQFYEAYKDDVIVSTVLTQLGWSNHLKILSRTKSAEERHFYITTAIKEHYSARELDRQITAMRYERSTISEKSRENLPIPHEIKKQFLDSYVFDVLNLPSRYSEKTLQKTIVKNLKDFILEIGKDFSFVGEEYRVQVGDSDFFIDLLFYHRGLSCLVAFELKITEFKPEYIGKMNFYLEALDREHRKENENPSVGIILCADKNDEIVEFSLSRNLSPVLVAEYTSKLPDKKLLQNKLRELTELAEAGERDE